MGDGWLAAALWIVSASFDVIMDDYRAWAAKRIDVGVDLGTVVLLGMRLTSLEMRMGVELTWLYLRTR